MTAGPVSVIVGRGPYLRFTLDGVRVNFSPIPMRGVMVRGLCRYEFASVTWRSRAAIALAGPAANFLELLWVAAVAIELWHRTGPVTRNLFALGLVTLAASVLVNLIPLPIRRPSAVLYNDGSIALAALLRHRAGTPPPVPARELTEPRRVSDMPSPVHAAAPEHQRDLARARTSIPPPSADPAAR